jgi:hypothetical protein
VYNVGDFTGHILQDEMHPILQNVAPFKPNSKMKGLRMANKETIGYLQLNAHENSNLWLPQFAMVQIISPKYHDKKTYKA